MALVGVSRRDFASNFRAFVEIPSYCEVCGGSASPVRLLEAAVTAIEVRHDLAAALAARRFGVDQRLHLIAPLLSLVGTADRAQIVQRTQDFSEPRQVAVKWCRRLALRVRRQPKAKQDRTNGEKLFHAFRSMSPCG
jgi:hypothetical protein